MNNSKKKLDNLSLLALVACALLAIVTLACTIAVAKQFTTSIEYKGALISYVEYVKLPAINTFSQAVLMLIMMPVATIASLVLFIDTYLRKEVSHIAATCTCGAVTFIYLAANAVVQFMSSGEGAGVFFAIGAVGAAAMIYFFVNKMLDGDATLGYKIAGGATLIGTLFGVCFAYPFLDMYSHSTESIFWTGGFFGIAMMVLMSVAFYVSISSDYDPNPIEIDEFGNPIDNDK